MGIRFWRNAAITTSLDRAKQFIAQKAHKLAIAAAPLAALALSTGIAHAGTLSPGNCYVSTNGGSGSCTFNSNGTGTAGDLTWIQMSGFGSAGSGGFLDFGNSGSGVASGSVSAETIPVSWSFTVSGSNMAADPVYYSIQLGLLYSIGSGGSTEVDFRQSGSWTAPGLETFSASFSVPAVALTGWDIGLYTSDNDSSYSINIPGGSTVDLNPGATTPEPASMLLMGAGGAALLVMRRRKRA
jgi:hypothetical protein